MQRLGAHLKLPTASVYLHAPHLDAFIQQQWHRAPGPTVIKAHELGPVVLNTLKAGRIRGICTLRDPRDSVASDMVFMGRGIEHSVARVNMSLQCLQASESAGATLFVRYEQMMSDRQNEIRRIARHLGIHADTSVIHAIDSKTNLQTSKTVCEDLRKGAIREVFAIDSHRVDPKTHLHENHIGNARVGRWKDELSSDQARYLNELFAPWLLKWGYETQESLGKLLAAPDAFLLEGDLAGKTVSSEAAENLIAEIVGPADMQVPADRL
jgi:hypothetical protein